MTFIYDDGGRAAAGFKGKTGDCVARALAIATGLPYQQVYDRLAEGNKNQRVTKHTRKSLAGKATARNGVYTGRKWFKDYMAELGFKWTPLAKVGEPTTTTVADMSGGTYVLSLRRHSAALIDGHLHDTWDSSYGGTAKVFGYWCREE